MAERFIRTYTKLDLSQITPHLLIYGDLSGTCAQCQKIDVKLNDPVCPECKTEFKYIAFRNIKSHMPKLTKLLAQRPSVVIIDHDDYKREKAASQAEDFFK
ncbi:MAG: hypothetical protein KC897_08130 [Candidatus Omnitrophica bacterium]|nr:hypothetical protein [Candidatus Omnitrophota bacterium]MCA9403734.1 hypothetical protein [Candidatus Omnitrophota bacterium]MCB9721337.1 hypothetical protein [Candidatus Omnitrophota bacterium]